MTKSEIDNIFEDNSDQQLHQPENNKDQELDELIKAQDELEAKKLEIQEKIKDKKQKKKSLNQKVKKQYSPYKILTITFPQKLEMSKKNKRKYQVLVLYNDANNKQRRRIVKFGNYKQNDVFEKKENIKVSQKKINKLKNSENVLQANYWRKHQLNKSEDFHQNFIEILKQNQL